MLHSFFMINQSALGYNLENKPITFFKFLILNIFKMSKLTLDALKERAEAVASNELLSSISGGTANACHKEPKTWQQVVLEFLQFMN